MIASAMKVNVATAMPSVRECDQTRILSVCNTYYVRGIPVYRKTTIS